MERESDYDYDNQPSLGDILSKALERKNMINVDKIVAFVRAARDTGRSDREVMEMLTNEEITSILEQATKIYPAPADSERRTVSARVENCYNVNRKIDAIKMVREKSGCGLLEAKQFIEGIRSLNLSRAEYDTINTELAKHGNVFLTN